MTFSADKLCPLNIGKQNITTEDDNNFLIFWACFFENLNFLHLASYHVKNYQDFLQKRNWIQALCLWILGKKMIKYCNTEDKKNFWCSEHAFFWKHISLHLFSYPSRIEQDYLQEKCIWDKLLRDKQKIELSKKNQFCKKPKNLVEKLWYARAAELFY